MFSSTYLPELFENIFRNLIFSTSKHCPPTCPSTLQHTSLSCCSQLPAHSSAPAVSPQTPGLQPDAVIRVLLSPPARSCTPTNPPRAKQWMLQLANLLPANTSLHSGASLHPSWPGRPAEDGPASTWETSSRWGCIHVGDPEKLLGWHELSSSHCTDLGREPADANLSCQSAHLLKINPKNKQVNKPLVRKQHQWPDRHGLAAGHTTSQLVHSSPGSMPHLEQWAH